MGRLLRWALVLLLCMVPWTGAGPAAHEHALRLGLMPYAPAETLLARFQPLERYLEHRLQQSVELVSAKDYAAFTGAMLGHDYDVAFTAPHLGLLAVERAGWVPLVRPDLTVQPVFVVRASSSFGALVALRGRIVAMADPLALTTICAEMALADAGLTPGVHVHLAYTASHASAVTMVQRGLADAAAVVSAVPAGLPPAQRGRLRELARLPDLFNLAFLASPRLPGPRRDALREALLDFATAPESDGFYAGEDVRHIPLDAPHLRVYARVLPRLLDRLRPEAGR